MNQKTYWKQQLPLLCLHIICMTALTLFLLLCGNSIDSIAFILLIWSVFLTAYLWKTIV